MVSESEVIYISTSKMDEMIEDGISSWFHIGLVAINDWPLDAYECRVIDEKRYMLARIKYGI